MSNPHDLMTPAHIRAINEELFDHLATLQSGFFAALAAVILALVAVFSLVHAVGRMLFGFLGLLLWAFALIVLFLYWLRAWILARSAGSGGRSIS